MWTADLHILSKCLIFNVVLYYYQISKRRSHYQNIILPFSIQKYDRFRHLLTKTLKKQLQEIYFTSRYLTTVFTQNFCIFHNSMDFETCFRNTHNVNNIHFSPRERNSDHSRSSDHSYKLELNFSREQFLVLRRPKQIQSIQLHQQAS